MYRVSNTKIFNAWLSVKQYEMPESPEFSILELNYIPIYILSNSLKKEYGNHKIEFELK